ncbi:AAA family ATPase [Mycobacterium intracellulare]|uniref:AAA family ATPase n=1 Tax=Mycobacterium intracellulare TaxID=1767 RepID=A0AAE4U7Q5_MYCIT|nr:AAA family ATPase [Mycobacterium intracellulare]MDV6975303.1 AAA family ATPase [Mycobacterium intracellulare]MDV6980367.1 AAA family ATPase [Mycobacterium intracellulare]MDV7010796.1 AAA family ATPase [Mycobacterium intracellulare]MDV7025702.1 AAA family ATPase [Mycobacterium intracellulare]
MARAGTRFLRGQLCLVCAGPGTGKSAFVLTYASRARVPTLYFSADSDAFTQLSRMQSILTGRPLSQSAEEISAERIDAVVDGVPIMFKYDASPSIQMIEDPLKAFAQKYGDYPAVVVVDNITNVRLDSGGEDDDPFSGLEGLMDYLHDMARKTGAFVIGLHHVTGPYNDANKPIPLSGIKGQIGRVPEMVLTLHRVPAEFGPDSLNVSTVKNRSGKADPSGFEFVSLSFEGDTMQIKDF